MKHRLQFVAVAGVLMGVAGSAVFADVAVVIEHQYTIGNNYFSAFAYNKLLDPHEFITTGYGYGKDLRWSRVLDDTIEPWEMEGQVLMDSGQIEFFGRDGFPSYSLSYNAWGMNFNPLDEKYFITCISVLKDPFHDNVRVETERDLIQFDPRLPNGSPVMPSGITISNTGGLYSLIDDDLSSTNGFVTRGVQVGDRLTLYALHYLAKIISGTYEVTAVVSENELLLDQDPLQSGAPTQVDNTSYIMMMQPWLTLQTFRQNIQYYADDSTAGPKAHFKGGLSPDGNTLYLSDIISENLIAVDTQQPETFSIFVSPQTLHDYVLAQNLAGRRHPIINADRAYADRIVSGWSRQSTYAIVDENVTSPVAVGSKSMGVTFTAGTGQLKLHASYGGEDVPRSSADYTHVRFWIHGGVDGGHLMDVSLYDHNGVPGNSVPVPPPMVEAWILVEIPIGDFGVATIGDIVFDNTAGMSQPVFYLDDVGLAWTEPLPEWVGMFDTNGAGLAASQTHCDSNGAVWFSEGQTDDILWTTNGVDLNAFLISNDIVAGYVAAGAIDPTDYTTLTNGVQIMGLIVDPMGTVYWSDNQTNSIWKAPVVNPAENMVHLATAGDIQDALGLGTRSPRGLNCFSIRGMELLTFNFVDSNTVFKVDLNTFDYGDFDGDFDVDLDDYDQLLACFTGPGGGLLPGCEICDLDDDQDVDCDDWLAFSEAWTGPPATPPVPPQCEATITLVSAFPEDQTRLWRTQNNFVWLEFDADLTAPNPGDILIQEMLAGPAYGADLSANFTITVDPGDAHLLNIKENGAVLSDRTWYAIRTQGGWTDVADFEVQYCLLMGDVTNDNYVKFGDASAIYPYVIPFPVSDDDRHDVNGDNYVKFGDASSVYPYVLPFPGPGNPHNP